MISSGRLARARILFYILHLVMHRISYFLQPIGTAFALVRASNALGSYSRQLTKRIFRARIVIFSLYL